MFYCCIDISMCDEYTWFMIKTAEQIIFSLGGIRPTARRLGKSHSTVQGWVRRGKIPPKHWPDVIEELAKEDVKTTDTELRSIYAA